MADTSSTLVLATKKAEAGKNPAFLDRNDFIKKIVAR